MFQNDLWVTEGPEPEHLGPENKKEDDHFPLNYSFWIDSVRLQQIWNKREREIHVCTNLRQLKERPGSEI